MKALFLTNEYPPNVYGGAGVHVEYLSRELARLMPLEVRCFGDQDLESGNLVAKGHSPRPGLTENTPKQLHSPLNTLSSCISFGADASDADVVHCHTWYSHFGGILCKQLYGMKLVVTTHSLEPLRPWKREQLGRGYDFSCWVERTALGMADAVVAVSQETKEDVLANFDNVDPSKVVVIPNGIDIEEYQNDPGGEQLAAYGIPDDVPYVLFVGRITRQKGIIHLLHAIEHLDEGTAVVLCAGAPDTPEIAAEMEALVATLKQRRQHIYWISEMVPKKVAIQLYSRAALFCCPSIYEPFGIINLEAMACKTAVVASATGGIKEVVVPEETGLLVPFEQKPAPDFDPSHPETFARDLATAINRLMADAPAREKMGLAGRKRVEERYSWSAIAAEVKALYEKILAG